MDISLEKKYPTPYAHSTILPLLLLALSSQKHSPKTAKNINSEYDYIIVGGGTAGSVVASRLSEQPCVNVLLLEAGKDPPLLTEVPALSRFFRHTDIDWGYKTVPQKHTGEALVNKEIPLAKGKSLGGSSVLNSAVVTRGSRLDYDGWAAKGAEGWGYQDVLPYFKKLEDNKDPEYVKNGFHSVGGLQTVQRPRYQPETKKPIFQAARSLGFRVVDPNAWKQTGFYDFQAPLREGQRCSTAKAYLVPAENRTNLDILNNAMVKKIIIKDGAAIGVSYDYQGEGYEVFARKEVILSAGAINTAQLLMLSGVGPKEELEKFQIPVLADLPVGENLQDHCAVPLNFVVNSSMPGIIQKLINPANIDLYIKAKTGVLSSEDFTTAVGFVNNDEILKNDAVSYQIRIHEETSLFPKLQHGLKTEVYAQVFGKYENKPFFSCISQTLHPRSRGTIKLRSSNPYDPPMIDPNYLANPKDVRDIVEGLKTCKRLAATPAMRKLGTTAFDTFYPGCEQYRRNEELYLWCLAKQVVISMNNPVGTTKMGNPLDPTTVVDAELKVKYLTRLRVVDASVMPTIISGDTSVPTIMIAEKASDIIKSLIDCDDYIVDSEVQESMPMFSISPRVFETLPTRIKNPSIERREDIILPLERLKEALGLQKHMKGTLQIGSSNKIESQIKELVKSIQELSLNRRRDDSSSTMREVIKCLDEFSRQIQRPKQSTLNIVSTSSNNYQNVLDQLVFALNDAVVTNSQNDNQNYDSNNDVSTILSQLSSVIRQLNGDRDVSETTASNSVTSSSGVTSTGSDALNQLLSAINGLREEGQQQLQTMDTNRRTNSNGQTALLNQILSSVQGIPPTSQSTGNAASSTATNSRTVQDLVNQIWTSVNEIRQIDELPRGPLNPNNNTDGSLNPNNNTDRTQEMMNQILTAVNEMRNATTQSEQVSITTPVSTGSAQDSMLSQILSTLNDMKQNNQTTRETENATRPSVTYNENSDNSVLREIFSAIKEMKEDIRATKNSTIPNSSNSQQNGNNIDLQNQNRLLHHLLSQQMNNNEPNAPLVETIIMPQTPVNEQINNPNPMLGPLMPPPVNGMQLLPPGISPGMPLDPVQNLLQRQRNLQMLSALNGGNLQGMNPQIGLPPQLMGLPPPLLANPQRLPFPPPFMNRLPGTLPNQMPCQNTIILNNINHCNRSAISRRPMTPNELELCQSLHSATKCHNTSNCRVPPYLYNYYCGKK